MFDELSYVDGVLYRKGKKAGWFEKSNGYWAIGYKGKTYLAHRVIWYLHHGRWPDNHIDHINQDRLDNRIENLRDVPHSVNIRNQRKIRGCYYDVTAEKWRAQISVKNKTVYLGLYTTLEEAMKKYQDTKAIVDSVAEGR